MTEKENQNNKRITEVDITKAKSLLCQKSFFYFFKEFWNEISEEDLILNWHIEYLANQLQTAGELLINRKPKDQDIIINIPPGTTKSTLISILFPAWLWTNDESIKIISGTYSGTLSTEQSVKSRTIILSEKYKKYFPWVRIKSDESGKTNYQTTRNGARYAVSTGSAVTGLHAHLLLIDDPQNPAEANSEVEREKTNDWVSSTISTRKINKEISLTILVQQRLHAQDVTGFLLTKQKKYQHICLPAIASDKVKPNELTKYYQNNLLDPIRLSLNILNETKLDLGTKTFNTQILQNPESNESSIIKEQWLKIIKKDDYNKLIEQYEKEFKQSPITDFYLDSAYTDDKQNDPSAIISTIKLNELLYITDTSQVWMEFTELIEHLKYFTQKNNYSNKSRINIEPKASGKSISQYLKSQTPLNVKEFQPPKGSKLERLNAISPKVESNKVILVEGKWNQAFIEEVSSNYPLHDDLRDTFIMAINDKLMKNNKFNPKRYMIVK